MRSLLVIAFVVVGLASAAARGERIIVPLWPGVPPGSERISEREKVVERGDGTRLIDRSISNVHTPTLTVHLPAKKPARPLAAMVICPGGGLTRIVIDKEGNDLAVFLAKHGVIGVVLKFRTARSASHFYGVRPMVADVRRAIRLTRAKSSQWNVDPRRVGVFGFSAGGILASTVATHFDLGDAKNRDPVARQSCRPDFFAAAYPLISMQTPVAGAHYQRLLFGKTPRKSEIDFYSNELHVSPRTPPTFLCHARDDRGVSVRNTLLFSAACKKAGVPCRLFVRDKGGHGYGIRDLGTPINQWRFAFLNWLKERKLTDAGE